MIVTEFYNGQGLGNQLWSYVVTRVLALDKGTSFSILHPERFKGSDFLRLDFGTILEGGSSLEGGPPWKLPNGITNYYREPGLWHIFDGYDVRGFQSDLISIPFNTKIDGYFQSEKYIEHRKNEIIGWLQVVQEFDVFRFSDPNICVLNIRGGEYKWHPNLLIDKSYWINAMNFMSTINSNVKFVVVTDDVTYSQEILPNVPAYHFSIGEDYAIIKNAFNLVLSNSSFAFFPAWINQVAKNIIAPKYWGRFNTSDGYWSCDFNLYKNWIWMDRSGCIFSYDDCVKERNSYVLDIRMYSDIPPHLRKSSLRKVLDLILTSLWRIKVWILSKAV